MVLSTANRDSYIGSLDTSSSVDEGTQSQSKTTILFNTVNGQPTTTSTQISQPTSSVDSTSVSLDAGVVPGATVPTTASSTSDPSSGQSIAEPHQTTVATSTSVPSLGRSTPESHVVTAVLGVSVSIFSILSLISIYYIYRFIKRRSQVRDVSKRPQPPTTPSNWSTSPLSSPNSLEKGGKSPLSNRTRPTTPRKLVESFSEKTGCQVGCDDESKQTGQSDGNRMTSAEDYDSHAGERNSRGRLHGTTSVREERLFRLRARNHSPRPRADRQERSQTLPAYDHSSLPPLPQQGPAEVRELTSILKRPSNTRADTATAAARGNGKGWLGGIQTRFGAEHETYKPTFAEEKAPVGRKGVTFAGYHIREFGRTPTASGTASVASGSADDQ